MFNQIISAVNLVKRKFKFYLNSKSITAKEQNITEATPLVVKKAMLTFFKSLCLIIVC
jgi:hypothetical protein